MLVAVFEAREDRQRGEMTVALFNAWQGQSLSRTKRLPDLSDMVKKLWPSKPMSPKQQRRAIMDMARAMGAKITYRKKES